MSKENQEAIEEQRRDLFERTNELEIIRHCGIGTGIIGLNTLDLDEIELKALSTGQNVSFFIPASGSGSRMFDFLYQFLEKGDASEEVTLFFDHINEFCFVEKLPVVVRDKIGTTEYSSIASYLLSKDGMNYGDKPKGLIPFHHYKQSSITPFQEQFIQSVDLVSGDGEIHFTVQEKYIADIRDSIEEVCSSKEQRSLLSFSVQKKMTDAYCFTDNGEIVFNGDEPLRRPAGHGALLANLNAIGEGIVLVKNIDNVQPIEKDVSSRYWRVLIGLLESFQVELLMLYEEFTVEQLNLFNQKYQLFLDDELASIDRDTIKEMLVRPSRVCGMVKNQGKPGGGPFWVQDSHGTSKQIVEKSQISSSYEQLEVMKRSSHFNPVFMALSNQDVFGRKVDLRDFVDSSKYLKVRKPHEGKEILYRELPGLWNGSMANWNTVFVELPESIFSPVKSVLDLLEPPHVGS